ncbi:MAG TPA: flagellar hook-basal body complex protein FliE [Acidimicrobiales bacterium]|nr:flagellar hook-basal body complex protein FliE [Acidimicrobiales bacterium]
MVAPIPSIPPMPPAPAPAAPSAVGADASFSNAVTSALDSLQQTQNQASSMAVQAAAGQGNIADAMVAATEASVQTQVTVALTQRAMSAFTDVMNMQF